MHYYECPNCQSRYFERPNQMDLRNGTLTLVHPICMKCFSTCGSGHGILAGQNNCQICGEPRRRFKLVTHALKPDDPDFGVTTTGSTSYPTTRDTIGGTTSSTGALTNNIRGWPIVPTHTGTIQTVGINLSAKGTNAHLRMGLYSTYNSGPKTFSGVLGQSASIPITAAGWNDVSIGNIYVTAGTTYYLVAESDSGNPNAYYVSSGTEYFVSYAYNSFPDPTGALSTTTLTFNVRITYVQIEGYTKGTQVQYVGPTTGPNAVTDFYFYTHTGAAGDHYTQALYNTGATVTASGNAGTCADDSSVGSVAWANPTNAQGACDTVVSTTGTLVPGALSHYLKATNLGFSLPSNVPILGITVVIRKSASSSTNVTDGHVRIVKGGSVSGDDKPSGTEWANSLTDSTYGSGSDLWGLSWTPSDINDSSFGVVIAAFNNGITGSRTASVDCFTVTVTYPSLNPYQRLWYSPSTSSASSTWNHLTEASGTRDNSWDGSLITAAYYWFMWQWDNVDPGPSYAAGSANTGIYKAQAYGTLDSTWSGGTLSAENWSGYLTYFEFTSAGSQII